VAAIPTRPVSLFVHPPTPSPSRKYVWSSSSLTSSTLPNSQRTPCELSAASCCLSSDRIWSKRPVVRRFPLPFISFLGFPVQFFHSVSLTPIRARPPLSCSPVPQLLPCASGKITPLSGRMFLFPLPPFFLQPNEFGVSCSAFSSSFVPLLFLPHFYLRYFDLSHRFVGSPHRRVLPPAILLSPLLLFPSRCALDSEFFFST